MVTIRKSLLGLAAALSALALSGCAGPGPVSGDITQQLAHDSQGA